MKSNRMSMKNLNEIFYDSINYANIFNQPSFNQTVLHVSQLQNKIIDILKNYMEKKKRIHRNIFKFCIQE